MASTWAISILGTSSAFSPLTSSTGASFFSVEETTWESPVANFSVSETSLVEIFCSSAFTLDLSSEVLTSNCVGSR